MKNIIFILLLILSSRIAAVAQQLNPKSEALVWEVGSLFDLTYDTLFDYSSSFVTYDQSKIAWVQGGGEFVLEFKVQSVKGNWTDINSDGLLQFRTTLDGKSGTVTFERKNGKTSVRMDFPDDGRNRFPFVFDITSVNRKS